MRLISGSAWQPLTHICWILTWVFFHLLKFKVEESADTVPLFVSSYHIELGIPGNSATSAIRSGGVVNSSLSIANVHRHVWTNLTPIIVALYQSIFSKAIYHSCCYYVSINPCAWIIPVCVRSRYPCYMILDVVQIRTDAEPNSIYGSHIGILIVNLGSSNGSK